MYVRPKILIHSIVFSPDAVSTAYLYNDIARALKSSGFEVTILTTTPHYNIVPNDLLKQPLKKKLLGLYYVSDFEGMIVYHVPQKKFKSTLLRYFGFVHWHLMSFLLGLFQRKINLILSPSPPITIGLINILLGKLKRAKVIYNVQEIYPDFLIERGGLKSKPIIKFLKLIEKTVYNRSDAVTTIDSVFYQTILSRFLEKDKLVVIPNFVDTSIYKPIEVKNLSIINSINEYNQSLRVMYAGNIGHAQDWNPLISVAEILKDDLIEFYIIGEGAQKDYLKQEIIKRNLTKIHLLPYQPRETMPDLIAFADIHFIFMSKKIEGHGFPSKVYTIMACSKPLLICSGENTPIVNFLKPIGCAKIISDDNEVQKVKQIVNFLRGHEKANLLEMGIRGYNEINGNYSKETVTGKYVNLIKSLVTQ